MDHVNLITVLFTGSPNIRRPLASFTYASNQYMLWPWVSLSPPMAFRAS